MSKTPQSFAEAMWEHFRKEEEMSLKGYIEKLDEGLAELDERLTALEERPRPACRVPHPDFCPHNCPHGHPCPLPQPPCYPIYPYKVTWVRSDSTTSVS